MLPAAVLRFPRRYPSSFLLLLIPVAVFLYHSTLPPINPFQLQRPQPLKNDRPVQVVESHQADPTRPIEAAEAAQPLEATLDESHQILLVSAFYPLTNSKHTLTEYKQWISNFLRPITTPIYIFTTPDLAPILAEIRGPYLPFTINTTFHSAYDIPQLQGRKEQYQRMRDLDLEKNLHRTSELYAIWTAKAYFLEEGLINSNAQRKTPYKYAFWNDAGSHRDDHTFSNWPNLERIDEVFKEGSKLTGTKEEELMFFPIWKEVPKRFADWKEEDGPADYIGWETLSEGSFFGGRAEVINWWRRVYYAYHDYYLDQKHYFVGKDQSLFNSIMLLYPDRFITVWAHDLGEEEDEKAKADDLTEDVTELFKLAEEHAAEGSTKNGDNSIGAAPDVPLLDEPVTTIPEPSAEPVTTIPHPSAEPTTGTSLTREKLPAWREWTQHPSSNARAHPLGDCGSDWFYYQFWFANELERNKMIGMWMQEWRWFGWWRSARRRCQMTRVLSMRSVLERSLGKTWKEPPATLDF